ncbi:MAG: hypothetical protein D6820_10725 [Lentisphaerae bacterium]|nr:MAG: hypothetical protein D6820_10725 [Lentisphaerota bacterium]
MRILVIKHGALGDVVRTSFILESLHEKFGSETEIWWLTSDAAFDLLRYHPYISKLVLASQLTSGKVAWVKEQRFDWVISLDDEPEACEILQDLEYDRLSGAYHDGTKMCYTDDVAPWFDMGLISRLGKETADRLKRENTKTHAQIFAEMLDIPYPRPSFYNNHLIERNVHRKYFADQNKFRVGVNLQAGSRWQSKALRMEEAIELIRQLRHQADEVLILGGIADFEKNRKLYLPFSEDERVVFIQPGQLLYFAAVIKYLNMIVSADSLALHLAIAQGVRNVSFYAPTSAAEIETFGTGVKVLSTSADYCSYRPDVDNSSITAARILEAIEELMGARV